MIDVQVIKQYAELFFEDILQVRRHLHQYPELSFQEFKTSEYIKETLRKQNIRFDDGYVQTGIVGIIQGVNPQKKLIALRADMDALPITEQNNVEYKSQYSGVMHACGHDVHTACVLGAARILNALKDQWEGTVILVFQPGEEKLPGGAKLMIEEGILEKYTITKMIGQHVFPTMETGNVGFRKGMYMASTDELYLTIYGKGGHAALPDSYNNPLILASRLLISLMDEFEKRRPKDFPSVLAFGKIEGAGATNVIPEFVKIEGTLRTLDESFRNTMHDFLENYSRDFIQSLGGNVLLEIKKGYPVLVNDHSFTEKCELAAAKYLGKEHVKQLELRMTAEDFAYYSQRIPVCFYRLGTGNKLKGIISNVHTGTFNVDEESLRIGMGLLAYLALNELNS